MHELMFNLLQYQTEAQLQKSASYVCNMYSVCVEVNTIEINKIIITIKCTRIRQPTNDDNEVKKKHQRLVCLCFRMCVRVQRLNEWMICGKIIRKL